ncbi:MAG: hypothetical protein RL685_1834 [Pseudomonadota bacterium]|jgi:hypothetical protein
MKARKLLRAAIFGLLCLPAVAQAHYVWIESETNAEARVYFGEFNEGVREKAGGRLDERAALEAWSVRADHAKLALELVKRPDHFALRLDKAAGWVLATDTKTEVKDYRKNHLGIVKPMFYARAAIANQPAAASPSLRLDMLPVAGDAKAVQVFFDGRPLAKAKVAVYAPNLWMQELQTDEQGKLTPATPWPGRYVLDVVHEEGKPGEFKGQRYEAVRHRMTLSFVR